MAVTKIQVTKALIKYLLRGDDEYARFLTYVMRKRIAWLIGGENIRTAQVLTACKELVSEGYLEQSQYSGSMYQFKKIHQERPSK